MVSAIDPTITLVLGFVGLLAVGLLAAHSLLLIEAIRQIADIRHQLDIDDRPRSYSLGQTAGQRLSDLLADELLDKLAHHGRELLEGQGLLVFLSSDCTTCRTVAQGL